VPPGLQQNLKSPITKPVVSSLRSLGFLKTSRGKLVRKDYILENGNSSPTPKFKSLTRSFGISKGGIQSPPVKHSSKGTHKISPRPLVYSTVAHSEAAFQRKIGTKSIIRSRYCQYFHKFGAYVVELFQFAL
jgi:hypothetical protein